MALKPIVLPITYKSDPKGLRTAQQQLTGLVSGIGKAVAGATAAVAGIGAISIKAFADFDSAMNQSIAIMGDVSDSMRTDMADAAREVAKTTTFSADQAAESFFFLASAGLDATQSIQALPKVANFAQAGMFDMALATDLLTDAQSALGLTVEDSAQNTANMAKVSDVLVKANTLANASVQQFSEALTNKAGPAMKAVGMDIEEGVAVLAAFADQGIKGSEAGTQFGIVLRDLQTRALENADAFADSGIAVFDAEGDFNNMGDIIGQLETRLSGMSDEAKRAELQQLGFADRSISALVALLGTSDAIKEYEAGLRNAAGTTDEVANKQLQTLSAQLDLLKSELVDVGIELGSHLAPAFETLITALKPVIKQVGAQLVMSFKLLMPVIIQLFEFIPVLIRAMMPLIPTMISIAGLVFELAGIFLPLFVQILDTLLPMIEGFTAFLQANADVVSMLVIGIGTAVAVVKTWNTIVGIAKLAMVAFNAVLAANPIGLIITALVALTAGLVFFFTQTETGKKVWAAFVEFVTVVATALGEFFRVLFTETIPGWWTAFTTFLSETWEGFKTGFVEGVQAIGDFFVGIWEGIKDIFFTIFDLITTGFKNYINGWIGFAEGFVNFFIRGINGIINAFNSLSVSIPDWVPDIGGRTFGININRIPEVRLPRLAEGGIVKKRPGGIIANIGEGRFDEAVVPLRPGMKMGSTVNITVNAGMGADGARIGEQIVKEIKRYERVSGPVFASA